MGSFSSTPQKPAPQQPQSKRRRTDHPQRPVVRVPHPVPPYHVQVSPVPSHPNIVRIRLTPHQQPLVHPDGILLVNTPNGPVQLLPSNVPFVQPSPSPVLQSPHPVQLVYPNGQRVHLQPVPVHACNNQYIKMIRVEGPNGYQYVPVQTAPNFVPQPQNFYPPCPVVSESNVDYPPPPYVPRENVQPQNFCAPPPYVPREIPNEALFNNPYDGHSLYGQYDVPRDVHFFPPSVEFDRQLSPQMVPNEKMEEKVDLELMKDSSSDIVQRPPVPNYGLSEAESIQFSLYFEHFGDKYDISVGVPDMETLLEIIRDNSGTIDTDQQAAIDIFVAVSSPTDIETFNQKLANTISSESILTNVAQWKKDNELQQSQKVERQLQLMQEIEEFEALDEEDLEDFEACIEYDDEDEDMDEDVEYDD